MTKEEKAYRSLEHPEEYSSLLERSKFDRKLLLFRYPSFAPRTSWSLFNTKNNYYLRRIVWDTSLSFPSHNIDPYTYGSEVVCPSNLAEDILLSLSSIAFRPLVQPEFLGIDGTVNGIVVGNYWLSCSLRWWYLPSDDWRTLARWFDRTVESFEELLPKNTYKLR